MELKLNPEMERLLGWMLLIVPYGIETILIVENLLQTELLIVPYGIETPFLFVKPLPARSFNCTLWN